MSSLLGPFTTSLSYVEVRKKYTLVLLDLEKSMTTSIIQKKHSAKRNIDFFGCVIYGTKCDRANLGNQVILYHIWYNVLFKVY